MSIQFCFAPVLRSAGVEEELANPEHLVAAAVQGITSTGGQMGLLARISVICGLVLASSLSGCDDPIIVVVPPSHERPLTA